MLKYQDSLSLNIPQQLAAIVIRGFQSFCVACLPFSTAGELVTWLRWQPATSDTKTSKDAKIPGIRLVFFPNRNTT